MRNDKIKLLSEHFKIVSQGLITLWVTSSLHSSPAWRQSGKDRKIGNWKLYSPPPISINWL